MNIKSKTSIILINVASVQKEKKQRKTTGGELVLELVQIHWGLTTDVTGQQWRAG